MILERFKAAPNPLCGVPQIVIENFALYVSVHINYLGIVNFKLLK